MWDSSDAAPIPAEKSFTQSGQKIVCDRVLILYRLLPVSIANPGSLNEVTANDNRVWWRNSRSFTRVAIVISKKPCKQAVVVYWFFARPMKIRNVKN